MGAQKAPFDSIEEVDAFDGLAVEAARPRQPIEGPDRCGEVVEGGGTRDADDYTRK
jgi:hypothetical protein